MSRMTDGERDIWNEMQRDAAPSWCIEPDCPATSECPLHCQEPTAPSHRHQPDGKPRPFTVCRYCESVIESGWVAAVR